MFSFSLAQVLVRLREQFINNFYFPTGACASGFNNNNNALLLIVTRIVLVTRFVWIVNIDWIIVIK